MVVGAATVILWKNFVVDADISKLYEMVPGFIAASFAIVAASLLDRVPVDAVRDTHAQVHDVARLDVAVHHARRSLKPNLRLHAFGVPAGARFTDNPQKPDGPSALRLFP